MSAGLTVIAEAGMDAEDMARALIGFRGQPVPRIPAMRRVRPPRNSDGGAYVFDEESAMVYIRD